MLRPVRFHHGHVDFCLSDAALIAQVARGAKPVGTIARRRPSRRLAARLAGDPRLVLLRAGDQNRWGAYMYVFAGAASADKRFSDYVDLGAVHAATHARLQLEDCSVREHVLGTAFLNETDNMVERGIVYGYPLWSSVALHIINTD